MVLLTGIGLREFPDTLAKIFRQEIIRVLNQRANLMSWRSSIFIGIFGYTTRKSNVMNR
jgi:hypothetical protein